MKSIHIVTGAAGHLGGTIVRMLAARGLAVRGLILPGETANRYPMVTYVTGDVRAPDSLRPLFANADGARLIVLHCAGIISIDEHVTPALRAVNVGGTQHVLSLCREYGVHKLVHVSSVHAIPEGNPLRVIREADHFDPALVHGAYAKTKAEATQLVLDAARAGLDASIVHPSGILGPYDESGNHLVQLVSSYIRGRLPAGVRGAYDFVDVRDVAQGCLAAAEQGMRGECYILSNQRYTISEVFGMIRDIHGGRSLPMLPIGVARLFAPWFAWRARRRHERPLYTAYSLYTLRSNSRFSHDKASRLLGYSARDLYDTLRDTIAWTDAPVPQQAAPAVQPL